MSAPPFKTAALLAALPHVRHGFFGRQGGVSTGLYASLNAGPGSSDDPAAIAENRARIAAAMGLSPERLISLYQTHSANVADAPWPGDRPHADGVICVESQWGLGILAADCAPILLADRTKPIIAAAHAGWKGALAGVIEATIAAMRARGAVDILAAIGPAIAQKSYEIGPEFLQKFIENDPFFAVFFTPGEGDRHHFDLKRFCAHRLAAAGIAEIEILPDDTCAEAELYFSNRRAFKAGEADYGRNLSVIALQTG